MTGSSWPMPDSTVKSDGTPRRVGIEFELQGIEVGMLARLTALTLGGDLEKISDAEYSIEVPGHGAYRVEIDYALLKQMARGSQDTDDRNKSLIESFTLDVLSAASSLIVPLEAVTPALAMEEMSEPVQALTDAIRDAGGKGTRHATLYAFGLHLNVEPPNLEASTVAAYMKAFVCLYDWLVWTGDVDMMRRTTSYIQKYPADYDLHLADPGYWPDWDDLIVDYLRSNANRNRALDMLPMFMEMNPAAVRLMVDDERVQARPAFHYRLANCEIDDPDWSIEDPWRRWLQIEHLANDRDALNACCEAYRSDRARLLHRIDNTWRETVTEWLRTF